MLTEKHNRGCHIFFLSLRKGKIGIPCSNQAVDCLGVPNIHEKVRHLLVSLDEINESLDEMNESLVLNRQVERPVIGAKMTFVLRQNPMK